MASLAIKSLTVNHLALRQQILNVQDLRFAGKHLSAIVGSNLSGRTALLQSLTGALQHSQAYHVELEASWDAVDSDRPTEFLPTADAVYLGPTPENLISGLTDSVGAEIALHQQCAWSRGEPPALMNVEHTVASIGITALLDRNPSELSGGQMASVALVSALALRRPLLCVDGLLAQLDVERRDAAYTLLASYAATGAIVLVAENDPDWVPRFAEIVVLIHRGCIQLKGAPTDVLRHESALALGCAPTAARYAHEINGETPSSRLPLTASEFIAFLRQEYDVA